jgi:hypothetical protein
MLEKFRDVAPWFALGFLLLWLGLFYKEMQEPRLVLTDWTLVISATPTPEPTPSGNLTIFGSYGTVEITPEGEVSVDGTSVICSPKAMQIVHHALVKP